MVRNFTTQPTTEGGVQMDVWGISLLVLGLVNLGLTIAVARAARYSRAQKLRQIVLLWVLPVLGAALVGYMLRDDDHRPDRPNPHANRNDLQAVDAYARHGDRVP